jgi:hypothetical protein
MKIFLLGDSFTDNLFKWHYNHISKSDGTINTDWIKTEEIAKYLDKLQRMGAPNPMWFDDWLREWGYDVYNFGKGGCSIEDIIYQFANIKNYGFEYGDRIILNWTHHSRFNWIKDNGTVNYVHTHADNIQNLELKLAFQEQTINRENSFNKGYLNQNLLPFMEYIVELHSKYKPIVWTPFYDLGKMISNQKYYFSFQSQFGQTHFLNKLPKNWSIKNETDGLINDGHFGRYGNYYLAILFHTIIENNIESNYNESTFIFDSALERIKLEKKVFPKIGQNII